MTPICFRGEFQVLERSCNISRRTHGQRYDLSATNSLISSLQEVCGHPAENVATNSKRQSRSDEPDQKPANKKARLQAQRPAKTDTPADKPAVKGRHAKATSNVTNNAPRAAEGTAAPADPQSIVVGSGRQAAQGVEYKEKASLSLPDSKVVVKEEHIAADEIQALDKTKSEGEGPRR